MRIEALRAKRRAELLEAFGRCEAVLKGAQFGAEYKRAFAALQSAGRRYDSARAEDAPALDDMSFFGAEPEEVAEAVNDALAEALETLRAIRRGL